MKIKIYLVLVTIISLVFSECKKEKPLEELVPKTVEQNRSLSNIEVNGTRLHAESFGNPSDPMLVFLHGGPGGDYRNALSVSQMTAHGFYVVFYDQRGSGLSQRHDKNAYSIAQVLDDLTGVINHYRTSPNQKVFLFGHSWGAMIACAYVNTYPDRIQGVIFAEAGGFTKHLLDEYAETSRKLNLFAEETNDVMYYDQMISGSEKDHETLDYKSAIQTSFSYGKGNAEGVEGPSPFWRNGAVVLNAFIDISEKEGFDFTTNLSSYKTPVLFIYGENNKSYGITFAKKEAAFFTNAQIVQIDNTGHEMIYFKWNLVQPIILSYLNPLKN